MSETTPFSVYRTFYNPMTRSHVVDMEVVKEPEKQLSEECAMLDWLESPCGRRFQKENQDALICRETIRMAMKEPTQ